MRLARFNIQGMAGADKRYFVGMPSPAAAAVPAATVYAFSDGLHDYRAALPALLMVLIPALLMVSTIRFRSFKTFDLRMRRPYTILLFFASRLASRVRRLHRQAEAAIDQQGRITGAIKATDEGDEIGDLTRTMSAVMERLRGYNAHLEAMAGRLSHELRTPVAVVRSSLDNLKAQPLPPGSSVYVERAGEGVDRLSRLISRLSEGTRLERMLESAERERFDVAALVAGCVEGYRLAYPARRFDLERPPEPLWVEGVPDAVEQLVDKLAENANDFAPAGSPVKVQVEPLGKGGARIAVENAGPPLPEAARARLFDSMVSLREPQARGQGAHLGLGLYIVRIVAEFHRGSVRAVDLPAGGGVRFEVELP